MSANNNRVQSIAMGGVVLTVLLIVGAFIVSIARGESFGDSLPVLLAFVTPTLTMLLAAAKLGGDVDKIKAQTNGNFTRERDRVRELADENRELSARLAAARSEALMDHEGLIDLVDAVCGYGARIRVLVNGDDAEAAKTQLGHTSTTVTERHYINRKLVVPDYRAATERLAPGSGSDQGPAPAR